MLIIGFIVSNPFCQKSFSSPFKEKDKLSLEISKSNENDDADNKEKFILIEEAVRSFISANLKSLAEGNYKFLIIPLTKPILDYNLYQKINTKKFIFPFFNNDNLIETQSKTENKYFINYSDDKHLNYSIFNQSKSYIEPQMYRNQRFLNINN